MKIWIFTVGEPFPYKNSNVRLLRTGILSKELTSRGHKVTWWASSFDHFSKEYLTPETTRDSWEGGDFVLLHSKTSYQKNISIQRILHNIEIAKEFTKEAKKEERPDLILASFPTIELCHSVLKYAKEKSVPLVVDVRDLWPDIFSNAVPSFLRPLTKIPLAPMIHKTREIMKGADAITGVSQGYLQWGLKYAGRDKRNTDDVFPIGYMAPQLPTSDNSSILKKLPPNKILVWFIGSFGKSYDLKTVIEAAKQLETKGHHDFHFVISGDGEAMPFLQKASEQLNSVTLTGWIEKEDILALQKEAHIGLMAYAPGAPQGLPNKFFEYLSAGLPILSSLEGECHKEIQTHGVGETYCPGKPNSLVEALLRLKDSSRRQEIQSRALQLFHDQYNGVQVYNRFALFLEKMV